MDYDDAYRTLNMKFEYDFTHLFNRGAFKAVGIPLVSKVEFHLAKYESIPSGVLTIFIKHSMPMAESSTRVTMLGKDAVRMLQSKLREVILLGNQQGFLRHAFGVDISNYPPVPTNDKIEIVSLPDDTMSVLNLFLGVAQDGYAHMSSITMKAEELNEVTAWLESNI